MMRTRRFGRLGIEISECTFGSAAISRPGVDAQQAIAALSLALEKGINAVEVDAADEQEIAIIGRVIRQQNLGERVHVLARMRAVRPLEMPSSHIYAHHAYTAESIRSDVEVLLGALGIEQLTVAMLHGWCAEWLDEGDWSETFEQLRAEGKIAGCGISLFDHDSAAGLDAAASRRIDCVQVMFNVFDPGPTEQLLPLCKANDIAVVARAPLYYGALGSTGGPRVHEADDWRRAYFYAEHRAETARRVRQLAEHAGTGSRLPSLALRFALSQPAISTVAVGMHTTSQVQSTLAAVEASSLSPEMLQEMSGHAWLC